MLSATFTGIILTHFENALAACAILTSFIPMLSGTGGNSGTQASTAVIRALSAALREKRRLIQRDDIAVFPLRAGFDHGGKVQHIHIFVV